MAPKSAYEMVPELGRLKDDVAYGDGWFLIVKPHEFDENQFLDATEYIEYLNEL